MKSMVGNEIIIIIFLDNSHILENKAESFNIILGSKKKSRRKLETIASCVVMNTQSTHVSVGFS